MFFAWQIKARLEWLKTFSSTNFLCYPDGVWTDKKIKSMHDTHFRFYGEAVVEACVESGTHHVDISGEPAFLEKMQLKYHQVSKKNPFSFILEETWCSFVLSRSARLIYES